MPVDPLEDIKAHANCTGTIRVCLDAWERHNLTIAGYSHLPPDRQLIESLRSQGYLVDDNPRLLRLRVIEVTSSLETRMPYFRNEVIQRCQASAEAVGLCREDLIRFTSMIRTLPVSGAQLGNLLKMIFCTIEEHNQQR